MTQSRGSFLKSAGLLVVSFGAFGAAGARARRTRRAPRPRARAHIPTPTSISSIRGSSFIEDNTATFYVGKTDCGQGTGTAFRQLMSDELDIAYDKTTCIMGSTDITVDQGGSGGSTAMERDSLAHAARRGRSAPRAAGDGIRAPRRAGRSARRQRRRDHREGRSLEERHLWTN